MGEFIANTIIKKLIHVNKVVKKSKVVISVLLIKKIARIQKLQGCRYN